MMIKDMELEDFYEIPSPSPKEAFMVLLTSYYNIENIKAVDIADMAIDLFRLDTDGSIPLDWEMILKNQA
jgi:vacuolar-type H+-ATPase subunit C/Vma6